MASIDYINALGAGASFDTKKIVEALVEAERAGAEQQIQRKLADAESKISGLGSAASILNILKEGAELLNDARDFNTLSIQNILQIYLCFNLRFDFRNRERLFKKTWR